MSTTSRPKLPSRPIYKMFFDGRETQRIMEWIKKLEAASDGNFGDMDLSPELETALNQLVQRIVAVESEIQNLNIPDLGPLTIRVNNVEGVQLKHDTQLESLETLTGVQQTTIGTIQTNLKTIGETLANLQTLVDSKASAINLNSLILKVGELEEALANLDLTGGDCQCDIAAISNDFIASLFE